MPALKKLLLIEKKFERTSKTHQLRVAVVVFGISVALGGLLAYAIRANETKDMERTLIEISEAQKKHMDQRLEILKQIRYAKKENN